MGLNREQVKTTLRMLRIIKKNNNILKEIQNSISYYIGTTRVFSLPLIIFEEA